MTNNTINVPRELLENIVLCYNEGEFELGTLAAECQALLSAPSPAGVDGCQHSHSAAPRQPEGETFIGEPLIAKFVVVSRESLQALFRAAGCSGAVENSEVVNAGVRAIDGLRGEVERLQRAEKNDAIAYKAALERQDELRAELAATKAQEPVGSIEIQGTGFLCAPFPAPAWAGGRQPAVGTKLYAAPVSEAKAQGVVMPERKEFPELMMADYHEVRGWNACLGEVARLNAAPCQHSRQHCNFTGGGHCDDCGAPIGTSVAAPVQQVSVPDVSAIAQEEGK